jgi:hypothetical protein
LKKAAYQGGAKKVYQGVTVEHNLTCLAGFTPEAAAAAIVVASIAASELAADSPQRSKSRDTVRFLAVVLVLLVAFPATGIEGGVTGNAPTRANNCRPEAKDVAEAEAMDGGPGLKRRIAVASETDREK